jgi:hypothetical protein
MKLTLNEQQANKAIREFLSDPGEDETGNMVTVHLHDDVPMRITVSRKGGLVVYTHEDAVMPVTPPRKEPAKKPAA